MHVTEAESRLIKLLGAEGFDASNPAPRKAWDVFKQFVTEPVECDNDGVLFQVGCYDGRCCFDFVRQFSINNENGEYSHMEQLHIEFTCEPTQQLIGLEKNLWAYDFQSLEDYFEKVESLEEFQKALLHSPWQCEVYQEIV
ncbi:MAG: hypothetical protein ACFFDI_30475 [Promethearchaeota archaeon]